MEGLLSAGPLLLSDFLMILVSRCAIEAVWPIILVVRYDNDARQARAEAAATTEALSVVRVSPRSAMAVHHNTSTAASFGADRQASLAMPGMDLVRPTDGY